MVRRLDYRIGGWSGPLKIVHPDCGRQLIVCNSKVNMRFDESRIHDLDLPEDLVSSSKD